MAMEGPSEEWHLSRDLEDEQEGCYAPSWDCVATQPHCEESPHCLGLTSPLPPAILSPKQPWLSLFWAVTRGFLLPSLPKAGLCPCSCSVPFWLLLPTRNGFHKASIYLCAWLKPLCAGYLQVLKHVSFNVNVASCQTQLEISTQTVFRGIKCPNDSQISLLSHSNLVFSSILLPCSSLIYMPITAVCNNFAIVSPVHLSVTSHCVYLSKI